MRRRHWLILLLVLSLVVHAGVIALLPDDGRLVEAVYARHIYPVLGPVVAFLPSLLPFSVAFSALLALAVWVPAWLAVHLLRWRRGRSAWRQAAARALAGYLAVGATLFHSYYLFWGYNYLRPPLEQRIGLDPDPNVPAASRTAFSRRFVAAAAAARVVVDDWDIDELDRLVDAAVADAVRLLENRPTPVVSPLKGDLGTGLLGRTGSYGFIAANTLEAHVDVHLPPFQLPFTAAHEKAHLAGFARERDANFVAWLALTRATDPRLRYSGYFGVVGYFLNAQTQALAEPLLPDRRALAEYVRATVTPAVRRTGQRLYGTYLRANRMPTGLADYSQVAGLIQAFEERS